MSAMLRRGRDRGRRVPPVGRPVLRPARVRARVHRRVLAPVRGPSADARSAHLARFRDVRGGRVRVRKHRVQLRDVRAHGPGVAHAAGRAGDVRGGGRGGPAVVRQVPVPETRPDAPLLRLQAVRLANGPPLPLDPQLRRAQELPILLQLPLLAVVRVHGHGVAHGGGGARRRRDQRLRLDPRRRRRTRRTTFVSFDDL